MGYTQGKPVGSARSVIARAGLDQPEYTITKARLQVFGRTLRFGSHALWATIVGHDWLQQVMDHIEPTREMSEQWMYTPAPKEDMCFWLDIFIDPAKKCLRKRLEQAAAKAEAEKERKRSEEKKEEEEGEADEGEEMLCSICGKEFPTLQAMASHKARAHGWRHQAWAHAATTQCGSCEREYWTRQRLVNHWKSAVGRRCLAALPAEPPEKAVENTMTKREEGETHMRFAPVCSIAPNPTDTPQMG